MSEVALTAVAVLLALTQPVPQIVRLARTRSAAGVSGPTAWLGLIINLAWMTYGISRSLVVVTIVSAPYVVGYAAIVALLVRSGNRRGPRTAIGAAVGLVAVTAFGGWTALGVVLALTVGAQFLPQVVEAWRAHDLTALAPGTYLVCLLDGLVWGGYGLAVADGPLVLYGIVMVTVAVLVLVPQQRWSRTVAVAG